MMMEIEDYSTAELIEFVIERIKNNERTLKNNIEFLEGKCNVKDRQFDHLRLRFDQLLECCDNQIEDILS